MSQDKLDNLLEPLILETQILDPSKSNEAKKVSLNSKFGGSPYAEEHDSWPQRPTCKNDLVFIAQLKDDKTGNLFVFYYCFECFPWGLGDEEKGQWIIRRYQNSSMEKYQEIFPYQKNETLVVPCTVSMKTVKALPDWEGLESHFNEAGDLCSEIDDDNPWEEYESAVIRNSCLNDYATLLGGYPRWVQGETTNKCPECDEELKFLGQIDSEDAAGIMWGDVGLVYLFQCKNHPDIFHMELQRH